MPAAKKQQTAQRRNKRSTKDRIAELKRTITVLEAKAASDRAIDNISTRVRAVVNDSGLSSAAKLALGLYPQSRGKGKNPRPVSLQTLIRAASLAGISPEKFFKN